MVFHSFQCFAEMLPILPILYATTIKASTTIHSIILVHYSFPMSCFQMRVYPSQNWYLKSHLLIESQINNYLE